MSHGEDLHLRSEPQVIRRQCSFSTFQSVSPGEDFSRSRRWKKLTSYFISSGTSRGFCSESCPLHWNLSLRLSLWIRRHMSLYIASRSDGSQTQKIQVKTCQRQRPHCPPLLAVFLLTLLTTSNGSLAARAQRGGKTHRAQELRCPPCRQIHCAIRDPKQLGCKGGVTTGVCGCCPACARLTGETCGGDLAYLGKCDQGLTCQPDPRPSSLPTYRIQRQPPGLCKKDATRSTEQADEAFTQQCRSRCTQHFCSRRPRAVCSASKGIAETAHPCQGSCQHTSCRACAMVDDIECVRCTGRDFRCLKQFGRCVARQRCRGKAGRRFCKRSRIKGNIGRRFVCKVPECPS